MRLLSRQAAIRLCADLAESHYDMRNVLLELLHHVVFCFSFIFCTAIVKYINIIVQPKCGRDFGLNGRKSPSTNSEVG
jgi:hypothetical protein